MMKELWDELHRYLKVETETSVDDDSDNPVTVIFTVSNTSSTDPSLPEVVFDEVRLTVSIPSQQHVENLGTLGPGESDKVVQSCDYEDLTELRYDIEGTVNPAAFFTLKRQEGGIPGDSISIPISAYLKVFNQATVYQWLSSTIKKMPTPTSDTTLGELQELGRPLDQASAEIRKTQERLGLLSSYVDRNNRHAREAVSAHQRAVQEYFRDTTTGLGEIRTMVNTGDIAGIAGMVKSVTERLSQHAARLDEATDHLSQA